MRDLIRAVMDAAASDGRTGPDEPERAAGAATELAAAAIRLARLATSLHLASAAQRMVEPREPRA